MLVKPKWTDKKVQSYPWQPLVLKCRLLSCSFSPSVFSVAGCFFSISCLLPIFLKKLQSQRKFSEAVSWHLCTCSAAALPSDLFAEHPTCCCGSLLWSLGDVRRPEFVGHSDDSKHLAARLLCAHQNKHRRVSSSPPTTPPVQFWLSLRE